MKKKLILIASIILLAIVCGCGKKPAANKMPVAEKPVVAGPVEATIAAEPTTPPTTSPEQSRPDKAIWVTIYYDPNSGKGPILVPGGDPNHP